MTPQTQTLLGGDREENFVSLLERNAKTFGTKPALLWDGGEMSWSELDQRGCGFARSLAKQGLGPGDRIATLLPNHWTFAVALLGILKLGASAATLHPTLKAEELSEVLADLKPRLVVDKVGNEKGVWSTPQSTSAPALIVYTSGSTGRPKGSLFSHRALTFANRAWGGPVMGIGPEDVVLGVLPFAHNYGMNAGLLAPLLFGAKVIIVEHFSPEAVFKNIERHRVTVFPGVATMFRRLLNSPEFPGADMSSLRLAVSGAAPCPWELCMEWKEKTGARILRGYGMTEVPRPISYLAAEPVDFPDAIGRAIPEVAVQVVDDHGRPLEHGEAGELWINCPGAASGYFNATEETQAVLTNGWFKTGDVATVSRDGFVRIMGRKRERILRGGYSVFPAEVERVLLSHPAVAEAAVVGIPSPDLNEEVAAFVVLQPAAEVSGEELVRYCEGHLAHYKFPRTVTAVPELPRSAIGKVLKAELLQRPHSHGAKQSAQTNNSQPTNASGKNVT